MISVFFWETVFKIFIITLLLSPIVIGWLIVKWSKETYKSQVEYYHRFMAKEQARFEQNPEFFKPLRVYPKKPKSFRQTLKEFFTT